MAKFVPQTADSSPQRVLALSVAVNAALRGDTANIGRFVCPAGESRVTVRDRRCRAGRLALLIPLNAAAAGLSWWLSAMTRDSMSFGFSAAPGAEAEFGWALIGDGDTKGA